MKQSKTNVGLDAFAIYLNEAAREDWGEVHRLLHTCSSLL